MSTLCIPIPDLHKHKTVDLEVTVDGQKRVVQFRVESFPWPDVLGPTDKVDLLKSYLTDTGEWELVQIGPPQGEVVPITFRKHVVEPVSAEDG